ncbi:MAG: putative metalloprotease CJM1_0395 family protein [Pseudomonadota bacterium]
MELSTYLPAIGMAGNIGRESPGNGQASLKSPAGAAGDSPSVRAGSPDGELTEAQERQVEKLKKRDAEVRAHEQAHAQVGGSYAGAPTYQYTKGPDGKKYATSGEVQIDSSPERTPEATIRKMEVVIRAALAPAEPSTQDQAVARQAQATKQQAQMELAKQRAAGVDTEAAGGMSALTSPLAAQATSSSWDSTATAAQAQKAMEAAVQAYQASANLYGLGG